jgi:protein O-mannosyl-transferase
MDRLDKNIVHLLYGALLIILISIALYGQSLGFDFLNLDDNLSITLNPVMHEGITVDGIKWAFTTFHSPYYMPLTRLSFLIDSSLYGMTPFGFHLSNLILHTLNALLVLTLAWLLSRRVLFSVITAIVFAIHPQHIEAFVWISERKEVLSSFFGLFALVFYVSHIRQASIHIGGKSESNNHYYLFAILCFLFSLMAKAAWITLPFMLLLIDWWPLQRYRRESLKTILADKIPFLLLVIAFILLTLYSAASGVDQISNSAQTLPLLQRILNAPVIYINYLYLSFFPADLPVYVPYPREALPAWQIIGSILLLLALTAFCFTVRKRQPHLLTGWLWFLGTLVPMLGIISAGESVFIANRWTYIAHIGLFAALVLTGVMYYEKHARARVWLVCALLSILLALSWTSWDQTRHWKNSESYWQQAIRTTRDNHFAHYMLGTYYFDNNKIDAAISEYERAYQLHPADAFYALRLGNVYGKKGEQARAWEYYTKLIKLAPPNIKLLVEMGLASLRSNRADMALEFFRAALESQVVQPHHHRLQYLALLYAGHTLSLLGATDEADAYMEKFIGSNPADRQGLCTYARDELSRITANYPDPLPASARLDKICR